MYLDHTCKGFFMHFGKGPEISEKNGKELMEGLIGSFNRYLAHASTVVKPTHMKIPCMTPPSTSQAYTVFNTVDKNNSNTISWSELLKAWNDLTEIANKEGKTFDPKMVEGVKRGTQKYFNENS
jgi:hypothetical protein